jgi:hypothetical protein
MSTSTSERDAAAQGIGPAMPDDPLVAAITKEMQLQDEIAGDSQRRTVSFAAFLAALSPLAVILLAVQAVIFPHGGRPAVLLIGGELLILAVALGLAYLRIGRSHGRWLDARLRCELLRRETFLVPTRIGPYLGEERPAKERAEARIGLIQARGTDPVDCLDLGDASGSWWEQLEDATHEPRHGSSAPIPDLRERSRNYLRERVIHQKEWFGRRGEEHATSARHWENGARIALVLAAIVAAIHLGMLIPDSGEQGRMMHVALVLAAIALPSLGSGLVGLLAILGSQRLSRAYRYNARMLQRIEDDLRKLHEKIASEAEPIDVLTYRFKRLVLRTEELISDDLRQWWLIMKPEAPRPGP